MFCRWAPAFNCCCVVDGRKVVAMWVDCKLARHSQSLQPYGWLRLDDACQLRPWLPCFALGQNPRRPHHASVLASWHNVHLWLAQVQWAACQPRFVTPR